MFSATKGQRSTPFTKGITSRCRHLLAAAGPFIGRAGQPMLNMTSTVLDMVLPQACAGCGLRLPAGGAGLCSGCLASLPGKSVPRCCQCALGLPVMNNAVWGSDQGDLRCSACTHNNPGDSPCLVLCDYASPVDQMVQALKFGRRWALGNALGASLATGLRERLRRHVPAAHPAWVCAVPLGPARLVERGFNQSELIARAFVRAINTGAPLGEPSLGYRRLLRRTRDTPAQSLLGLLERQNNLNGAFAARLRLNSATVVVIDDVMTSGATLAAAEEALRRAGAGLVIRVALARAA